MAKGIGRTLDLIPGNKLASKIDPVQSQKRTLGAIDEVSGAKGKREAAAAEVAAADKARAASEKAASDKAASDKAEADKVLADKAKRDAAADKLNQSRRRSLIGEGDKSTRRRFLRGAK